MNGINLAQVMEKRGALLTQNKPLDFIKDEGFLEHLSGS
jgi:hypothetical protein